MKTVGIISLGLIGGSILKSLKGKYNLIGITQNEETIKSAKVYASVVSRNMNELKICDFIFVASHMDTVSHLTVTRDDIKALKLNNVVVPDDNEILEY